MNRATLSVLGLYNVRPDIFDPMQLPKIVDRDVLLPELLAQCAELESLYSDPDTLKSLIGPWSRRRMWSWEKLADTLTLKYNPIWNVDGTETETIMRSLNATGQEATQNSAESSGEELRSSFGYNSGEPEPADRSDRSGTSSAMGSSTADRSEAETITTEKTRGGNIGVTTTQKMINEEREIALFDLTQFIIDDFKGRFCLLLY